MFHYYSHCCLHYYCCPRAAVVVALKIYHETPLHSPVFIITLACTENCVILPHNFPLLRLKQTWQDKSNIYLFFVYLCTFSGSLVWIFFYFIGRQGGCFVCVYVCVRISCMCTLLLFMSSIFPFSQLFLVFSLQIFFALSVLKRR